MLLVDDHRQVRQSVAAVLEAAGDIVVCGEAGAVPEAERVAAATEPDVAVIDLRLGADSGITAGRGIRARRPATHVILLTSASDEDAMFATVLAGADGYLVKQLDVGELVGAVRAAARGGHVVAPSPAVVARLRALAADGSGRGPDEGGEGDEQLLDLVIEGRTNGQIGEELHLGEAVVRDRVTTLLSHLEAGRRSARGTAAADPAGSGPRPG